MQKMSIYRLRPSACLPEEINACLIDNLPIGRSLFRDSDATDEDEDEDAEEFTGFTGDLEDLEDEAEEYVTLLPSVLDDL